jgi:neuron navigator 2
LAAARFEPTFPANDVLCSPVYPSEIRNGNLKTILGLFFILSRYKQQQQQQQQYYQSLVELTHQTTGAAPASPLKTQPEMQSR